MVSFVTFLLCGVMARAEKVGYPEQKLLAKGVERLEISGVKGHVKLSGRPGKVFRFKVRHSKSRKFQDWSLSVDRRGSALVFEVFSVAYGPQWRSQLTKDLWPEFDVEIEGPSTPAVVSWREGELEFVRWSAPIEATQVNGRVSVKNGAADYRLDVGQSDVNIDGLAGKLSIKGDRGSVRVSDLTGSLDLNWIRGDLDLKRLVGDAVVESSEANLRLRSCKGDWDIRIHKGQVAIDDCSGKLKAEGDRTAWSVRRSSISDAEIKSGDGPVRWDWKAGGAKVFLTSNSGSISGPKIRFGLDREGRKVSEFVVGRKPFAQVFVKTQSGPIHFQQ